MHQFGDETHMANAWKHDRAKAAIDARINDVKTVTVVDYTRDTSLKSIPTSKAYRVDGVHIYVEIVNFDDMLWSTETEGETCHKRALRFLNLHYRAVHRILADANAIRVDFHNQRLHAVVAKPYGDDSAEDRVNRAVAIAKLITDVLAETGDDDEKIPNAQLRIGIDTGKTLAVNNGRSGNREPLFLGRPANIAAKLASNNEAVGIYLSNEARAASGLDAADDPAMTKLTDEEIKACDASAKLGLSKEKIVADWRKDNEANPIGAFAFSRATPPLKNLDISVLTPGNSRRMEMVSIYADVDNFTAYVNAHIDDEPENVVRCLHVIRAELDRIISADFSGRRIRFIGDCIHGHILEGTAYNTDTDATSPLRYFVLADFAAVSILLSNAFRITVWTQTIWALPSALTLARVRSHALECRGAAFGARPAARCCCPRPNRSGAMERKRQSASLPTKRGRLRYGSSSGRPVGSLN